MYTEETAAPEYWRPEVVALMGIVLIAAAFIVPPGPPAVYLHWAVGFIAGIASLTMSGNRRWERPVAAGAAIWLFISGFMPSMLQGRALWLNLVVVGTLFVLTAVSAFFHLRDDVRHARPQTM